MKECKDCLEVKSLDDFGTRKGGQYIRTACKLCYNARLKAWRDQHTTNIEGVIRKGTSLRRKYGISVEQFEDMYISQNGACFTCRVPNDGVLMHVDHDHETGIVRGLLCRKCNFALGLANDDPSLLRTLADYVEANYV